MIGDFTWTGWDYLGEAGIGRVAVRRRPDRGPVRGALPVAARARAATSTSPGTAGPRRYYREIVFGLRHEPYLAVLPARAPRRGLVGAPWAWSRRGRQWSLAGHEGKPVTVEVYADADEVELLVDGSLVGPAPVGRSTGSAPSSRSPTRRAS